jgi:hypothetical protein
MRVLIETLDSVGQTDIKLCATEFEFKIDILSLQLTWENAFCNKNSEVALRGWFAKMHDQYVKGYVGRGDDCQLNIEGCIFSIAFLDDSGKHTGEYWGLNYMYGPITKQQHEDPWRTMENAMNMIVQYS